MTLDSEETDYLRRMYNGLSMDEVLIHVRTAGTVTIYRKRAPTNLLRRPTAGNAMVLSVDLPFAFFLDQ